MKKRLIVFMIAFCLILTSSSSMKAAADERCTPSGIRYEDIGGKLDEYIHQYEAGLASCEAAVFDRNGMITNRYYGYSDLENQVPADEATVYDWGSCSKLLTWVSVMQQVERGNIDLDADIREYLPEGFLTKLQYEDETITMMNLMNHNAGFQESFYENQECGQEDLYDNLEEALKACECYQAYHVGEYTAYSNYGTALAAFIVERTSGMDYREYVRENIFKPLGMERTSIDPRISDNEYVRIKREELKCYGRYEDPDDNEDYGVCHSWVQLYPAGSVIGTLHDFSLFGMALVSPQNALFEKEGTWDEMMSATSFYGDTAISKNCHGLWTTECKVQILGHAGNTAGCSSMFDFDPVSGLGVVIMTNEPGETMFNYGIPNLLFGSITDREEYADGYLTDEEEISGIYFMKRTIDSGAVSFQKYTMTFPINKNEDGCYNIAFGGLNVDPDHRLYKIGDNQYLLEKNGMKEFLYHSVTEDGKQKLEMMSTDMIAGKSETAKMFFLFATLVFGLLCIIALAVKLILLIIWKIRKKSFSFNVPVSVLQVIYGINLIVLFFYLNSSGNHSYWFAVVSSLLAAGMGVISIVCGGALLLRVCKRTDWSGQHEEAENGTLFCRASKGTETDPMGAVERRKQSSLFFHAFKGTDSEIKAKGCRRFTACFWSFSAVMFLLYTITFQLYQFWTL